MALSDAAIFAQNSCLQSFLFECIKDLDVLAFELPLVLLDCEYVQLNSSYFFVLLSISIKSINLGNRLEKK
jgi:hypothetical protein